MEQICLVMNAFLRTDSFIRLEAALQEASKKLGLAIQTRLNDQFIQEAAIKNCPSRVLFFDKDLRLAQRMEAAGLRLFNSKQAIEDCDDKTISYLLLNQAGIAQPKTLLCPASFPSIGYGNFGFLQEVADNLGFPLVVKEGLGSFGKQVYLVHSMDELHRQTAKADGKPLLFQRFIQESAGEDLRLYVVQGRTIAAIKRRNLEGDFRANLGRGGQAMAHAFSQEEAALAEAACAALGADFAGVDLLVSREGPLVCEVNSNAHFLGLREATGINPAEEIMKMIRDSI